MRALSVPGDYAWNTDAACISMTARNTSRTTEGPTIFRANQGDTSLPAGSTGGFYLFVDDFTGAGYLPLFSESLASPQWRTVTGALPPSRHGSVLPVSLNQWESAKGAALTKVGTTTALVGVAEGDVLEPGAVVTARVAASDGGAVAGSVRFRFGDTLVDAPVVSSAGGYVAEATVPDLDAVVTLSASFAGFDVLTGSDAAAVEVTVGSPAPELAVSGAVAARCVAGKVVQAVTVSNTDDVALSVSLVSPYGTKSLGSIAAGKAVSATFSSRLAAIPAGSVTLTATAVVDGESVAVEQTLPFAAAHCG